MLTGMPIELPEEGLPWFEALPTVTFERSYMTGRGPAPYGYVYAGEDDDGFSVYRAHGNEWEPSQATECSEPGRYFVSVRRDDGAFRLIGPRGMPLPYGTANPRYAFAWQCDALRALPAVKAEWMDLDPRACWYAWGTARER